MRLIASPPPANPVLFQQKGNLVGGGGKGGWTNVRLLFNFWYKIKD
jgi:hypothetical protein